MLCISRKVGSEIVINGNIVIKVTSIHGTIVRLAIDAPKAVPILRAELLEPKHAKAS